MDTAIKITALFGLFMAGVIWIIKDNSTEARIDNMISFEHVSALTGLDFDSLKRISHGEIIDSNNASIMKHWLTVEGHVLGKSYTGWGSPLGNGYGNRIPECPEGLRFSQNLDGFSYSILESHAPLYSKEQTEICLGKAIKELLEIVQTEERIKIKNAEEAKIQLAQKNSNTESWH